MLSPWLQTLLLPAAAASSLVLAIATLVVGVNLISDATSQVLER